MEKRRKKKNMKKKKDEEAVLPKVYKEGEGSFSYADIVKQGIQPLEEPRNAIKYVISNHKEEAEKKEELKYVLQKKPKTQNPWYIIKENGSLKIIKKDVFKKTIPKEAEKRAIPSERYPELYLGNIKNSNGKKKSSSAQVNCTVLTEKKKERIVVPATTIPHLQGSTFVVGPILPGQLPKLEGYIY